MTLNEFAIFIDYGLIDKSSIIEDYRSVKHVTEAADMREESAKKINFDPELFYFNLPAWSDNFSAIANDEDIYWYTSDFDDFGIYKGKLKHILSKVHLLFELGINDITIIDKNLTSFICFDVYIYQGQWFYEIRYYGRFEYLLFNTIEA